MTDRELRAAAIGVLVYEHLMQTGGAVIEHDADGGLAIAADLVDEFMEYTLKVCSEVDLEAGSEFWMEGMGGLGRNLPRDLPRDN